MAPASSRRPLSTRWLIAGLAFACRSDPAPANLDLVIPDGGGRRTSLVVRSAFAEYAELGDLGRELRITLASYALSCERYVAPGAEDLLLVVTVTVPASEPVRPGTVPALGFEAGGAPNAAPTRPSALPVLRSGERSYVFPPGGSVDLTELDLSPTGRVRGVLSLEFAGDGTRPAIGARGKFEARICRPQ